MPTGVLPVPLGPAFNVVQRSAAYAAAYDDYVTCDTSLGGFTVTLPSAVGASGRVVAVRKATTDANVVTVNTVGGQMINGDPTAIVLGPYTSISLVSDGSNWMIS